MPLKGGRVFCVFFDEEQFFFWGGGGNLQLRLSFIGSKNCKENLMSPFLNVGFEHIILKGGLNNDGLFPPVFFESGP